MTINYNTTLVFAKKKKEKTKKVGNLAGHFTKEVGEKHRPSRFKQQ